MIEPAIQPAQLFLLARDRPVPRIEIKPRALWIVVAHAQHRQRQSPIAVVVIRVVAVEPADALDGSAAHRDARSAEHQVRRQLIAGAELRFVKRHDAGRGGGVIVAAKSNNLHFLRQARRERLEHSLHSIDRHVIKIDRASGDARALIPCRRRAGVPVPRVHRQQTTEDPRGRHHTEDQPGVMVPSHPACVWRPLPAIAETVAAPRRDPPDPPRHSDDTHQRAGD